MHGCAVESPGPRAGASTFPSAEIGRWKSAAAGKNQVLIRAGPVFLGAGANLKHKVSTKINIKLILYYLVKLLFEIDT